jgi:hypothetical protein
MAAELRNGSQNQIQMEANKFGGDAAHAVA